MEYLFVLAGGFAALFLFTLLSIKGKKINHWFLAALLFLIIISCFYVFKLYHSNGLYYVPYFSELNFAIPILYGVLLWFYTKSLLTKTFSLKPIDGMHIIPFVLFCIFLLFKMSNDETDDVAINMGYPFIKLIINPIYIFLTLSFLHKFKSQAHNEFSYDVQMNHYWLSWVAYGGLMLWIVACIGNIYNWYNDYESHILGDYLLVSFLAIFLFILAYVGFNRTKIFQTKEDVEIQLDMEPKLDRVEAVLDDSQKELYDNLIHYMNTEKPYLDSKLSLRALSDRTKISSNRLSQIINHYSKQNFYDFVNGYRIKAVKSKLKSEDMEVYSILGIAEECGFNSKASFNRVFKKKEGMTPTEYLKKAKV